MIQHHEGSCHCGSVRFSFDGEPITKGLRCTCSLCARRGAVMSHEPFPAEQLKISAEEGALGCYRFGARTAGHYFCRHCGIYTFHESARRPGQVRVNLGCVEGIDPLSLETDVFDGKHLL